MGFFGIKNRCAVGVCFGVSSGAVFVDEVFRIFCVFMGNLSCILDYLGNSAYLFLLNRLFLWYDLPIYIINIWI